jgi:hypothetical protein
MPGKGCVARGPRAALDTTEVDAHRTEPQATALVFIGNGRGCRRSISTRFASYCIAGALRRHGLDELALQYFGIQEIPPAT